MVEEQKNYKNGFLVKQSFSEDFVEFLCNMYDKYGEEIFAIQGISNKYMDIANFAKNFFTKSNVADISADGNANVKEKNITQYDYENNKSLMKLNNIYRIYKKIKKCFSKEEAQECIEKIINGELFINDLSTLNPYCFSYDLRELVEYGMAFMKGGLHIGKPKRSESFINLVIQSMAYISNQTAGACGLPSFFATLNKFYEKELGTDYADRLNDSEVWFKIKNQFQSLIYSMNFPYRGSQSSFTNLSIMDKGFLESLFGEYTFYDGEKVNIDNTYKLSKKFFEYFVDIQCKEGIFTFPVISLNCSINKETKEFLDTEFVNWLSEVNCGKAIGNVYIGEPTSISQCCRFKTSLEKVNDNGFSNSFGVGGLSVGSTRVCGLNLPRLALLEKENPNILKQNLECIRKILYAHRVIVEQQVKDGYLPLYTHNWINIKKQYCTIGLIGAYEYIKNKNMDIMTDGKEEIKTLVKTIENISEEWAVEYKSKGKHIPFNIEQIPGESMAVRLAAIDNILGYNKTYELYSNQYIPLIEDAPIYNRFVVQGEIDKFTSGGAILHINVEDSVSLNKEQYFKLCDTARLTGTQYFAVNYAYSEDENGNFIIGVHKTSPINGSKIVEVYTRVVGFITPRSAFNKVRREFEFPNRYFYNNGEVDEIKMS